MITAEEMVLCLFLAALSGLLLWFIFVFIEDQRKQDQAFEEFRKKLKELMDASTD